MAISFVGITTAAATTLTLPSHQKGDVILMSYLGPVNVTPPNDWIVIGGTASTTRGGMYYKVATGTDSESCGTWTSTSLLVCTVYRDSANWIEPAGAVIGSGSAFILYAFALGSARYTQNNQNIYVAEHWTYNKDDVDVAGNVGSFTNRGYLQSGGYSVCGLDSNGTISRAYTNQSRTFTVGTSGFYTVSMVQLIDTGIPLAGGGSSGISQLINGGLVRGQVL